jgi:ribosomal protein L12E/L44/L45/RPP1/RPP2
MAGEEENLSKTLEGSDQDEEMPTASEAVVSAAACASSDDDSGSEEEDDEGADELRIQALEQALRNQPLDYDSHLQVF